MKSEIHIEGILGPSEESTVNSSSISVPNEQIVNVQIATNYPKTGEYHNHYLFFTGLCLLILLLVLKMKKVQ
ncbi:MAG: LPXTG cell wall anchor domain-containing protein [Enterococcus sp.]